ncbi:hypothetical protein CALVIDRAFT_531430 [Calocera viscosa TUFC12733]|uniref:Uncharacterized protein n=1 Tax=Calocera viscosa (strain TUFC12733) TaxID=1330018 RepID=A0A167GG54_CALVF|nr:hypothetical protein CALVIDRAFT_531430 [Calocera viscosa TUFC12733]
MALSELGINRDFASPLANRAARKLPPTLRTASQPAASPTPDAATFLDSAFPAQSTPHRAGVEEFSKPKKIDRNMPRPAGHAATHTTPQAFAHHFNNLTETRHVVPESPDAWAGASMASYDASSDLPLGFDQHESFSGFLAGQPSQQGDSNSSISDDAHIWMPDDFAKLLQDLEPRAESPNNRLDPGYPRFLDDLSLFSVAGAMAGNRAESNQPANQPTDASPSSAPAWPAGREALQAIPSRTAAPQAPESSSSGSESHVSGVGSTPTHSSKSSSKSKSPSPSAAALLAADESGNPFWHEIMETSFEDEEDNQLEIAEAFKKRAKIICSSYYKDTYDHTSGALPPDSRTAIKFCRQLTRGLVEFLCQHYNLQQQRVWKEIGAFVGWARSINSWNMFQRKWRDELPAGQPFNAEACRSAYTEQAAQDPVELHARLSAWHEAHMAPDGRPIQPAERRKVMEDVLKLTTHMYSMYDRCCDIGARVEIGSLHPLDGVDMYHVYETKRMQGYTEQAYRRTPDGCKIAWVYFTAKQAHGQVNNPPPDVIDRRRPENLKVAREDIQRTGKRLLHEMKLLSDPNAAQPASCPWRASWLKFAIKHRCTIINWPDDAPWPHELPAQLQNSVDQDIVPIWRAFTTQNPAHAVHVKLWSKEAIQEPMIQNPPLIMRPDGQLWSYRDEQHRAQEAEEDDAGDYTPAPASTTSRHREGAGRPSKRPKARQAARNAPRKNKEPPHSAYEEPPSQLDSENDDSRPAGPASDRISRPHTNPLKRKVSDIVEIAEDELPSVPGAAYADDEQFDVHDRQGIRMPDGGRSGHAPPQRYQYHRGPSPPAGQQEVPHEELAARDMRSNHLMRHEPYSQPLGHSVPQDGGHTYTFHHHHSHLPRPAARVVSPSGRRADLPQGALMFGEHQSQHNRRYPPSRDAPLLRSQEYGVDHGWYAPNGAPSRPDSPGRPAIPRSERAVVEPANGMGIMDNGRYAQAIPYPTVHYQLPHPRPMPPRTADGPPPPRPQLWVRNGPPTPSRALL